MSYCNGRSLAWVVELHKQGQLDCQKGGGLKKTAGSRIKHPLSWLRHLDPGCPGLRDGHGRYWASGRNKLKKAK